MTCGELHHIIDVNINGTGIHVGGIIHRLGDAFILSFKLKLYHLLVECDPYIHNRYVQYKQRQLGGGLRGRIRKGGYLALCHFRRWILRESAETDNPPYRKGVESSLSFLGKPEQLARELDAFDVISFDIFDTLLRRPFAAPVDLFHLVGEKLGYMNYAALRHDTEELCRKKQLENGCSCEVTLEQIYALMEKRTGVPAELGMETELRIECDLLYANPYMKEVFDILRQRGKRMIAVSDTYFSSAFIWKVLEKNGYHGIEKLFLSCEHGRGKHDGGLFDTVRACLGQGPRCVHIGDNEQTDVVMAKKKGFAAAYRPNINLSGARYRTARQSRIIGSAYAGVVNGHLHSGFAEYTPFYEYGFIFGGLFVTGYCNFIHEYVSSRRIDRVLFLARDGDVLKQAYDFLYPGNDSRYVYWSRSAAAKLGADYFRADYLRRFLFHKTGREQNIGEILHAMELGPIREPLLRQSGLTLEDALDNNSRKRLEKAILENWQSIIECYQASQFAARLYFEEVLEGCSKACTVDVGWTGSGGVILSHLAEKKWKLDCKLTGLIAGTASPNTDQPDAVEALLQSGKISSYLFSQSNNREYWKTYDPPGKGYVLFFEALLASPTPGFSGFALPDSGVGYRLIFHDEDERTAKNARETQAGVLDFVRKYAGHFAGYPYMLHIPGSDAFAPFAAAMNKNGAYFRRLFQDSVFEPDVAGKVRTIDEVIRR